MSQVPQSSGAIDRRPDVVALVPKPNLAGVDPDAQPDRGQRCPLQVQRTSDRVGRAGESDHEAVALALLDRADSITGGDDVQHHLIEARHSGGHLIRLGFPQPRRTLDVGQQQRHRSGRKVAHAHVTPVSFAHANQHPVTRIAEHQRNR